MNTLLSEDLDGALMERVRSGDDAALDALVQRHWTPLVAYSAKLVGTTDAAEEVVQESFVRLWETRRRWNPGGSVRGFLFRTARNLGLGMLRHLEVRRRTEPAVRGEIETASSSPLDGLAEEELRQALWRALDALPSRRREALTLVRLRGLSLQQAADEMELSRQTVANHISLALTDLGRALSEYRD